ncbi:NADPH:quinone reductase [Granulicella rosea]|uniref:NADPH:quinone reductase n=1 Tax=Granulicella rosea TaxID=474952 RepID=A0A239HIX6_9BACT|nr:zinc-dependent alcohol dehydrogenase family protein [Granulicella rosea]SNS81376.1 NADPH:quinone reductase [Granulicella rosea]
MKVWVVNEAGSQFEAVERPLPTVGADQVLIRVEASGVNPLDTKIRAGNAAHARHPFPAVMGIDVAGTIELVGEGVKHFQVGDDVYGMTGGVAGLQGSLAQFQAADAALLARKPSNLTMAEAAALPLAAITAWEGLVDRAQVSAGQSVLIHGGAGGVGHLAVQIALAFGAEVHATVSPEKSYVVKRYGAIPIDYLTLTPDEYISLSPDGGGWEIVYDTVGGSALDASFKLVKKYTGHALSCLGWGSHSLAPLSFRGASYSGVFTLLPLLTGEGRTHHGEILSRVTQMVESGKVRPLLAERVFEDSEIDAAHSAVARGSLGKTVVRINA